MARRISSIKNILGDIGINVQACGGLFVGDIIGILSSLALPLLLHTVPAGKGNDG